MRRALVLAAVLAAGLISGCVSSADKALVQTGAAVADGDLANWDAKNADGSPKMTDEQKKTACWKLCRAMHVLDFSFNDTPLADQFKTTIPPWRATTAPATTAPATTTAKTGGK